jgi:LacI family transcriptional regulator
LLDRMMRGKSIQAKGYLVPPLGVVTRRSTDALAINDPDVSAAARFIRDHACEPIGVKHVLRIVPISRRALERRFLGVLGRTPHQEILRCRLEKARHLLSTTDLPIKAIAQRIGIGNPEYLSVVFKRATGATPAAYRRQPV